MSGAPIAVLQMTSGIDPEANFRTIADAAEEAANAGAAILFTPEMALLLDRDRKRAAQTMAGPDYGKYQERLQSLAQETGITLVVGSMPVPLEDGRFANRTHYFGNNTPKPITYDKIHMFDVELETGETWRESSVYAPGETIVTVEDSPLGMLGFSICYDVRFPAVFEALGNKGCNAIAVPAAFTVPTGKAHWHLMLRARAVEASAFVIAAAQVGKHEDGRETYGHSLVVDPWGEVLLDMGGEAAGLAYCEVDLSRIDAVRKQVPSLANRREIRT